jgi:hypothetical protein
VKSVCGGSFPGIAIAEYKGDPAVNPPLSHFLMGRPQQINGTLAPAAGKPTEWKHLPLPPSFQNLLINPTLEYLIKTNKIRCRGQRLFGKEIVSRLLNIIFVKMNLRTILRLTAIR